MTKINPFTKPVERRDKVTLALKIISLLFQILVLVLIAVGLLTYFIGFHNKPPKVEESEPCPNKFSGSVCDECGIIHNQPNVRIAGGMEVSNNSWPASVHFIFDYVNYLRINGSWVYLSRRLACGATLINRRTILTAAHCIIEKIDFVHNGAPYSIDVTLNTYRISWSEMYKVYLDSHDVSSLSSWIFRSEARQVGVVEFTRHEDYDPDTHLNNLAVMKLAYEVELDHNTQIACLPDPDLETYPVNLNIDGWIVGWGETFSGGSPVTFNRNARITVYDDLTCFSGGNSYYLDSKKQLCGGSATSDACQGDSGNALYVKETVDGMEKFIIAGIVSHGASCATGPPSVFTRVSAYSDWILHHVSY
ncbi:secreted salivary gland [Brachionus plicatilis]|uniref:Secreted salivary gland n=1 Tax=Brachionus plicatilis TaxID=10195 RepID=A0A3M7SM94_BRAPC|nr:secreted salivary gland [Brachionus plicatilis]